MVILCLFVLPVRWHIHLRHFLELGTARVWSLEPGARVLSVLGLITCLTAQPPLTKTPCYKCYILLHVWSLEPNVSCGVGQQTLMTNWFHLSRKWEIIGKWLFFPAFPARWQRCNAFIPVAYQSLETTLMWSCQLVRWFVLKDNLDNDWNVQLERISLIFLSLFCQN